MKTRSLVSFISHVKTEPVWVSALFASAALAAGAATLPSGYTEIEYIESTTAGQYVNTGYCPNSNTVMTVEAQLTILPSVRTGQHTAIFGTAGGTVTFKCYADWKNDNPPDAYRTGCNDVDEWKPTKAYANLTRTKFVLSAPQKFLSIMDMKDGYVYFDETGISPGEVANYQLDLFAYCNGNHGQQTGPMKLYSARIEENGVAQRDFVPCVNASGVAGLYDTVGTTFYPSSNSKAAFVAGPVLIADTVNESTKCANLTFPASSAARSLYLVGGVFDSAALATNWTYEAKLADVAASATSLDAVAFPTSFFRSGCKRYRFQIRSAAGAVEASTVTRISTLRDDAGRFNVYADAVALYSGAEDVNGNGLFDQGDWTDVRHAADPNAVTHTVIRSGGGPATNLVVRTVDVFSPTMDKTLKDQSCVFMRQGVKTWTEGDKIIRQVYPTPMNIRYPIVGDTYTLIYRFRPGPHQTVPSGGDTWLASLGCRWNCCGAYFGFHSLVGSGDPPEAHYMIFSNGDNTYANATGLVVSNQFWHEAAFVVSGKYARVELANASLRGMQNHTLFKVHEKADAFPPDSAKCKSGAPCLFWNKDQHYQWIGNGSASLVTKTNNSYLTKDFRGDIHLFACWNRALSHAEIVEAFAEAQPSQWRVGLTGCSADVLCGPASGDVTAGTNPSDWRKIPRTLAQGQKVTLSFTIEESQANQAQAVRLIPAGTADATVSFKLDGADLGTARLSGTTPALVFARKRQMTAGAHTLTVERTDAGATALTIDTLEMCGSWQLGQRDGYVREFGPYSASGMERFVIPFAGKEYPGTVYNDRVITLRFFVPAEFLGKVRYRYLTNHPYWCHAEGTDDTLVYALNGTEIGREWKQDNTDVVMEFPQNLIQAGENVLQIRMVNPLSDPEKEKPWSQLDFHRLEMRVNSGLVILFR